MKSLASSEKERSEEGCNGWASGEDPAVTGRHETRDVPVPCPCWSLHAQLASASVACLDFCFRVASRRRASLGGVRPLLLGPDRPQPSAIASDDSRSMGLTSN
jgi:hypothetical protein